MKKFLSILICGALLLILAGCGGENKTGKDLQTEQKEGEVKYSVGDIITIGSYEQDNDASNGKEAIEWRILDVQGEKALVISKYGLDAKPYNEELADVTWETCTLRAWLNNDFFDASFTDEEKAKIPVVTVTADINPYSDINPGNDTQDNIFLLSTIEAEKYFASNGDRVCIPTEYAIANGIQIKEGVYNCWWWLRSPGGYQNFAWRVHYYGDLEGSSGHSVDTDYFAVRPAMWIELD